jgi:hypothetical protein
MKIIFRAVHNLLKFDQILSIIFAKILSAKFRYNFVRDSAKFHEIIVTKFHKYREINFNFVLVSYFAKWKKRLAYPPYSRIWGSNAHWCHIGTVVSLTAVLGTNKNLHSCAIDTVGYIGELQAIFVKACLFVSGAKTLMENTLRSKMLCQKYTKTVVKIRWWVIAVYRCITEGNCYHFDGVNR